MHTICGTAENAEREKETQCAAHTPNVHSHLADTAKKKTKPHQHSHKKKETIKYVRTLFT